MFTFKNTKKAFGPYSIYPAISPRPSKGSTGPCKAFTKLNCVMDQLCQNENRCWLFPLKNRGCFCLIGPT